MMLTYNHAAFLPEALDSALEQETSFPYEIVVGEDASTDGTHAILYRYARAHPDRIRPLFREANLGFHRNLVETYRACRGRYIALLEGDDYWTDPRKLQRQVDFLERHPGCAICFHPVRIVFQGGRREARVTNRNQRPISTIRDLARGNFIHTPSAMFRNGLVAEFPPGFDRCPMADWPLHMLNARHGTIGHLDHVMSAYRVHGGGVWGHRPRAERVLATLDAQWVVRDWFKGPVRAAITDAMRHRLGSLVLRRGTPPATRLRLLGRLVRLGPLSLAAAAVRLGLGERPPGRGEAR